MSEMQNQKPVTQNPVAPAPVQSAPTPAPLPQTPSAVQTPSVKVVFYCKDCRKIVAGVKVGNKYVYKCPVCSTKNVAFGTEKSIKSFYHVAN